MYADLHLHLLFCVVHCICLNRVQNALKLIAQKHGNDGRRRFIRTKAVIVAGRCNRDTQQILIFVHSLDDRTKEQQELRVFVWRIAGLKQVYPCVGAERPVVVLAAPVHAFKWLFVQQADEAMLFCKLLHDFHRDLVVVCCNVRGGKNRRKLMLGGRDLVVFGFRKHTELPKLGIKVLHERGNARFDRAEVMIFKFLPLGRHCAKERAAGVKQVLAPGEQLFINKEILLLRANGYIYRSNVRIAKELQHAHGLAADSLHGAQQRGFFVQHLSAVGAERRGNAERVVFDESVGGWVPCCVAACFKRGTQPAGRKAGGIRFATHELFAGKLHNHMPALDGGNKAVVLFRSDAGHGLKPVGKMRSALFNGPILHRIGHHVRHGSVQAPAVADGVLHCPVGLLREPFLHNRVVEYHASKKF